MRESTRWPTSDTDLLLSTPLVAANLRGLVRRSSRIPVPRAQYLRSLRFQNLKLWYGDTPAAATWLVNEAVAEHAEPRIVAHINIHNYYLLQKDPALLARLERNALLIFEGIGMKTAGLVWGAGWRPDLNGTDMLPWVLRQSSRRRLPVFFLGARERVVSEAARRVLKRFPNLNLVGFRGGYFSAQEEQAVVDEIRQSGAKLLLVGRGFPLQERFALDHRAQLGAKLIWNIGGLFDFLAGAKPRAPLWMRHARLEWLFRLGLEPREKWRRIMVSAPSVIASTAGKRLFLRNRRP